MGSTPDLPQSGQLFGFPLLGHLNQRHPLTQLAALIDPSSLTRWRKRLGETGMEELLTQTIEAASSA